MKYSMRLTLLLFLALEPHWSAQQTAMLSVTPKHAITGETVEFVCSHDSLDSAAVYYVLRRTRDSSGNTQAVKLDVKCSGADVLILKKENAPGFESVRPTSCKSMTVSVTAVNRGFSDRYNCEMQHITSDFRQLTTKSEPVNLTVGDTTPPVRQFSLTIVDTSQPVAKEGGEVAAGTKVSVACETDPVDPAPKFTISVGGVQRPPVEPDAGAVGVSRVAFETLVPRVPSVVYHCSVFNGFGEAQVSQFTVAVIYDADRSEVMIPKDTELQTAKEVLICSVANNPPKRLQIAGLAEGLMQPGYPRYEEADGFSRAYVKLTETAAGSSAKQLEFTCGMAGFGQPVNGNVQLIGVEAASTQAPSSAMMTIGIVIAVVVVFIMVVAAVAFALKRRSAANKATNNSDKPGYGKVDQNDVDEHHPTYESNPSGMKQIKVLNEEPAV